MSRRPRRLRLDDPALTRRLEEAIAAQRAAVPLPADEVERRATIRRSDVDAAVALWREANAGTRIAGLLDGPAGESEDG